MRVSPQGSAEVHLSYVSSMYQIKNKRVRCRYSFKKLCMASLAIGIACSRQADVKPGVKIRPRLKPPSAKGGHRWMVLNTKFMVWMSLSEETLWERIDNTVDSVWSEESTWMRLIQRELPDL